VHLAVGYELVYLVVVVAAAVWLFVLRDQRLRDASAARALPPGTIFWLFVLLYGLERFVISFLRIADPTSLLGLRQDQLIGLGAMAVSIPVLLYLLARSRSRTGATAPA
jgi:prolipoprotein diacylglyceryltransferase